MRHLAELILEENLEGLGLECYRTCEGSTAHRFLQNTIDTVFAADFVERRNRQYQSQESRLASGLRQKSVHRT